LAVEIGVALPSSCGSLPFAVGPLISLCHTFLARLFASALLSGSDVEKKEQRYSSAPIAAAATTINANSCTSRRMSAIASQLEQKIEAVQQERDRVNVEMKKTASSSRNEKARRLVSRLEDCDEVSKRNIRRKGRAAC
jgi:uncharacterized membrane protein YhiD involved in acid resistance